MKYKRKIEGLHESSQHINGREPFLRFPRPWMVVNWSSGALGSHNFLEGHFESMARLQKGDRLIFQMVRESLVPMKWYERVWDWIKKEWTTP